MPPIRNKYVLVVSALALMLGAVLLWRAQPSVSVLGAYAKDLANESAPSEIIDESVPEVTRTSSPEGSATAPSPQPATDENEDPANAAPDISPPTNTIAASASRSGSKSDQASPTEADTPRLSARVFDVISEVQTLQLAGQWEEGLNEMNALWRELDTLNPFEQATLLNFYTNTLARLEMWQESITAFNMILQVPDLRPDLSARALLALGQLHARVGEPTEGAAYLTEWLSYTNGMENMNALTPRVNEMLVCLRGIDGDSSGCTF